MSQVILHIFLLVSFASIANASLSSPPKLGGYQTSKSLPGSKIGHVVICLDDTIIYTKIGKKKRPATSKLAINHQQYIESGTNSRCLIQLKSGDRLTLGNNTLIQLVKNKQRFIVHFWHGSLILTVKKKGQWQINMAQGTALLTQGTYALKSRHQQEADVVTYNHNAQWQAKKTTALPKQSILKSRNQSISITPLNDPLKQTIRNRVSPELPYLSKTLKLFNHNQFTKAKQQFQQLQSAYPNNSESAYYLGTIALKAGNHKETIKQWERFLKLDPVKAEKRDIQRNLTLVKRKEDEKRIKKIIANESLYSTEPAEPGTIAVLPFANEGDKEYNIISKGITAMVITDLSKVPGLKVLEREKIQRLMDELTLSKSGLVDKTTSLKAGKLMRAEKVIEGRFKIEK